MKVIDVHAHLSCRFSLGLRHTTAEETELIQAICQQFEIERCLISAIVAMVYDLQEGNALTAAAVAARETWYGYITVNASYLAASLAEIDRYAEEEKFVGIKNHPYYSHEPINSPNNLKIMEHVQNQEHHLPMLFHTYSTADAHAAVDAAKHFPDQAIIMGHMGGPEWHKAMPVLGEAGEAGRNIFVEPCCSHPNADKIRCARDHVGASRLLFGTDMPIISPAQTLGMVDGAALPPVEKEQLLYSNALRLFRW